ncbi:MAG: serine/threonine-protein kinase, partial [Kofleriaceae bacterium]
MNPGVPTETRVLEDAPAHEPADDTAWLEGQTIDRFVVQRVVGRGGMGLVVEAHDPALDRRVAIKLVLGRRASSNAGQRLLREARAMARLSHPNVVSVHEVGTFEGQVFLVMELVRGRTLEDVPNAKALAAFAAAGAGLRAAHRVGLIHRDFKPSNVLVDEDGRIRVTDFGIALQLAPDLDELDDDLGDDDLGDDDSDESDGDGDGERDDESDGDGDDESEGDDGSDDGSDGSDESDE